MWSRLDDTFVDHPVIAGLSDIAYRVYVTSIVWAGKHLTDGHVPAGVLPQLRGTPKIARELVAASLWDLTVDGWLIRNYLRYQPSGADVRERRDKQATGKATAGARGAHVRWHVNESIVDTACKFCMADQWQTDSRTDSTGMAEPVTEAWLKNGPVPVPIPTDSSSSSTASSEPSDDDEGIWSRWALKRLAATRAAGVHVAAPERWLASTRANLWGHWADAVDACREAYPELTDDAVIAEMEGEEAGRAPRDPCGDCGGRGIVELPDGTCTPCGCMVAS